MNKSSKTTEIRLLGQRIALKTSEKDPDLVDHVVELVTKKLTQAERRAKTGQGQHVALLALLDLAEEYVQAKRRTQEFQDRVEAKSTQLLSLLENESK